MRVYLNLKFNIGAQVKFKDTLLYVENILKNNGFYFENIAFNMENGNAEKLLRKFPVFSKYAILDKKYRDNYTTNSKTLYVDNFNNEKFKELNDKLKQHGSIQYITLNDRMSSFSTDWLNNENYHIDVGHHKLMSEVLSYIPKTYNFDAISIILDNVNWFEKTNKTFSLSRGIKGNIVLPSGYGSDGLQSNLIEIIKHFDYGNKKNIIVAKIEVTNKFEELLDYKSIEKNLIKNFGKIIEKNIVVTFDDKESKYLEKSKIKINQILNGLSLLYKCNSSNKYLCEEKIAPKKLISSLSKKYKYFSYYNGYYTFIYKNINNYLFILNFDLYSCNIIRADLNIKGYNFEFRYEFEQKKYENQRMLKDLIEIFYKNADEIEVNITNEIKELFGDSPAWYFST